MIVAIYIVQVSINDYASADTPTAATPASSREAAFREIAEGIASLASRRRCAVARRVHRSGISLGHLQILWILQEHGPLPVSRLADWLGIGAPNATGLLDRMEQRGLVERVRDADDRRVVLACMTDQGRVAIAEHDGWRVELIEQVLEPLPTDQLLAVAAGVRHARHEAVDSPPPKCTIEHAPADLASRAGVVPSRGAPAR
jgi:DNA-binding MarR family transcriptional regulator